MWLASPFRAHLYGTALMYGEHLWGVTMMGDILWGVTIMGGISEYRWSVTIMGDAP